MSLKLRALSPTFGVEVLDLDLAAPISGATFSELENAFNEHSLLLIRNQKLNPDQHVAISERFGKLQDHVLKDFRSDANPNVLVLSNIVDNDKPKGIGDAGQMWHADTSYNATPCRCSLLLGLIIPERDGDRSFGDTKFLSATAAYDALSNAEKKNLDGLSAPHSYIHYYNQKMAAGSVRPTLTDEQKDEVPAVDHPVVLAHPITGRKAIYVNRGYTSEINQMGAEEGKALLERLFDHLTQPEFTYRHQWQPGDILIWDNYSTQHLAVADYKLPQKRLMNRTTVLLDDKAQKILEKARSVA